MTTAIGTRIRLVQGVDNYPEVYVKEGITGTLVRIESDCYWIKLDKHFPELDEWNNELQIWDWSKENDGKYHPETYIEAI